MCACPRGEDPQVVVEYALDDLERLESLAITEAMWERSVDNWRLSRRCVKAQLLGAQIDLLVYESRNLQEVVQMGLKATDIYVRGTELSTEDEAWNEKQRRMNRVDRESYASQLDAACLSIAQRWALLAALLSCLASQPNTIFGIAWILFGVLLLGAPAPFPITESISRPPSLSVICRHTTAPARPGPKSRTVAATTCFSS